MTKLSLLALAALAAASLAAAAQPAYAQSSRPHEEACTSWGFMRDASYTFGAVNMCEHPVHIWFLPRGEQVTDARVDANTVFSTGVAISEFRGNWIAATCREGYEPNTPVTAENWDTILNSNYRCVRRRR
ncbi:hypothetical protein [Terricaulis sp.]|uniref:hypothetical protein n=1 Tax=Terricaulis sp. TaxID=2768686 RepID=UPI00378527FE